MPSLLRCLKLKEGLIEIVHLAPLRATLLPEEAARRIMGRQFDRCPCELRITGCHSVPRHEKTLMHGHVRTGVASCRADGTNPRKSLSWEDDMAPTSRLAIALSCVFSLMMATEAA